MLVYGLHVYIIVGCTREILMCCISTIEERVEEHVISFYRINFHLSHYKFHIGLYVNIEKWWNVKFFAK
jgi:hypothetical protein